MSDRIRKVNELIKRELSDIILEKASFPKDVLVTLTRVETSLDLNKTKVYISVIPEKHFENIIKFLNQNRRKLQKKLGKRIKTKQTPKIEFKEEKKTREADRIEKILDKIKKKKK